MLDAWWLMLDAWRLMLDARCLMLGAWCLMRARWFMAWPGPGRCAPWPCGRASPSWPWAMSHEQRAMSHEPWSMHQASSNNHQARVTENQKCEIKRDMNHIINFLAPSGPRECIRNKLVNIWPGRHSDQKDFRYENIKMRQPSISIRCFQFGRVFEMPLKCANAIRLMLMR